MCLCVFRRSQSDEEKSRTHTHTAVLRMATRSLLALNSFVTKCQVSQDAFAILDVVQQLILWGLIRYNIYARLSGQTTDSEHLNSGIKMRANLSHSALPFPLPHCTSNRMVSFADDPALPCACLPVVFFIFQADRLNGVGDSSQAENRRRDCRSCNMKSKNRMIAHRDIGCEVKYANRIK